jgi:hypothetical protein
MSFCDQFPEKLSYCQLLVLVVIESGEPGRQALHRSLEFRMEINERAQLISEPGESDLIVTPPRLQFLDSPIGEVHGRCLREGLLHEGTLLLQVNTC